MPKNSPVRVKILMGISGALGLVFFVIANFTKMLYGFDILVGCIQVTINVFVFLTWRQGFRQCTGFGKFVACIGTVVPVIMATVTIIRVLLPALFNSP